MRCVGGALADKVDRGRGVTGAAHQAVGAVEDVDLLIFGHVQVATQQPGAEGRAYAIVFEVIDVEPTRSEVGAVCFILLDRHGRRAAQRVLDAVEVEIIQLFAGQTGDALGGFLGRKAQSRGGAVERLLVAVRRNVALRTGLHVGLGQGQRVGKSGRCGGPYNGQQG